MWYTWCILALVTCALGAPQRAVEGGVATTVRPPPRTLDRQAAELAWRSWLQSPESGNQNAPPRRITTKSLFITPLVCPKGQRLDRDGCVQVLTVNKDEHERILLEQLNALFTSEPSGDVLYDYGDSEPLQLSIPIGFEPQAAPLQANLQTAESQENYVKIDKKDQDKSDADASIEAELENLKHQHAAEISKLQQFNLRPNNDTGLPDKLIDPSVLNNFLSYPDKPKRDSSLAIETTTTDLPDADQGQKEVIFGNVNYDPYLDSKIYETTGTTETEITTPYDEVTPTESNIQTTTETNNNRTSESEHLPQSNTKTANAQQNNDNNNITKKDDKAQLHELKKDVDKTKLNPENEYSDIGQAIKLISRYAEVTTDDSFSKDQKKYADKDDEVLGTRTRLQHRRNKPKPTDDIEDQSMRFKPEADNVGKLSSHSFYPKSSTYYRYPWVAQHSPTPPPDYPFRHLQDYWPGKNQVGLYNTARVNPRRHHHSYPHNSYGYHGAYYPPPVLTPLGYSGPYLSSHEVYPPQHARPPHRVVQHNAEPIRLYNNNQDLYSLLGLRHWFSSEGSTKR